jgi:PKD repeat protein
MQVLYRFFSRSLMLSLAVFFLYFNNIERSSATHVMGADIQFECIGKDSFMVSFQLYRDCNGVNLGAAANLSITGLDGSCGGSLSLTRQSINDITPVCSDECTKCESQSCSFQFGMELHTYTGILDLSNSNCCEFRFSYSLCCRNNAIENISNPGGSVFNTRAELNICVDEGCPTTPEFTMDPVAIMCNEVEFIYNQGAFSIDGDSLSYKMVDPLQGAGAGSPVSWVGDFNAREPLVYYGMQFGPDMSFPLGFHLDSVTGDMMFTPMDDMQGIMTIEVTQWRNDSVVSRVRRDLQFAVIDCPDNNPPILDVDYNHEVCAGTNLSIPIFVTDPDSSPPDPDSVYLDWNGAIEGATMDPDSGLVYAQSVFSWTPEQSDARPSPHRFVVSGRDNACPVPAIVARAVSIRVKPQPMANISYTINDCGEVQFTANLINVGAASFEWSGGGGIRSTQSSFTHKFKEPGTYPFTLTLLSDDCANLYIDTVIVPEFITVDAGENKLICEGDDIFVATQTQYEVGNVSYQWSTGETTPTVSNTFYSDTSVIVFVEDESGCINSDTVHVDVIQNPVADLGSDIRICGGTSADIFSGFPDAYQHQWTNLANNQVFSVDSMVSIADSGTYVVEVIDTSSVACYGSDTIAVFVNPEVSVIVDPPEICYGEESTLTADGGNEFMWLSIDSVFLAQGPEYVVSPEETTEYIVVAHSTIKGVYCEDSDIVEVVVHPLPVVEAPDRGPLCEDHGSFHLGFGVPNGGRWFGPGVSNRFFDTRNVGPGSYWLKHDFTDARGCYNIDSTEMIVHALPEIDEMDNVHLCSWDDPYVLRANPPGGVWAGHRIQQAQGQYWIDPREVNLGTHVYTYTYEDQNGCVNTETKRITISQTREAIPGEYGPFCIDNGLVTLQGSPGGPGGSWEGTGVTGNRFDPAEAGAGSHELTFTYVTGQGCTDQATTTIVVNPLPVVTASIEDDISLVCETEESVGLIGSPAGAGGRWSGPGTSGNAFRPGTAGPGNHELVYEFEDANGCVNDDAVEIEVEAAPSVTILSGGDVLCVGVPYNLEASYTNAPGGIVWSTSGDGTFSPNANADAIEYIPGPADDASGAFTVQLQSVSVDGQVCAVATDEISVEMHPRPETAFTVDRISGCEPHEVFFTDQSETPWGETTVTGWNWNFGDGTTSSEEHPSHTFAQAGSYIVTLNTESSEGCQGNPVSMTIDVHPRPEADFVADPEVTTIITPMIRFENRTLEKGAETGYTWNFGDHVVPGGGESDAVNPVYQLHRYGPLHDHPVCSKQLRL